MAGGYLPLTVKKLDTPEAVNEVNRMFKELFDQVAGDGQTVRDLSGYGSPESAVSASVGSTYRRLDGTSGTTLYKKESGTGATGWVSVDPMTTLGDTDYHDGTKTVRLAGNTTTTRKYLSQVGNGSVSSAPTWEAVTAGSKFGTLTRDASDATGSVGYTGVGFQPTGLFFYMRYASSTTLYSIGADNASSRICILQSLTPATRTESSYSIYLDNTGGSYQRGSVSSLDSDGFTISWEKGASPSGAMTVFYLAVK